VVLRVTDDPRPLWTLSELLERKLGVPVTYEDAMWAAENDLIAASEHPGNRNSPSREQLRNLAPVGGTEEIRFRIEAGSRKAVDPPVALVNSLVAAHSAARNPGVFEALPSGSNGGFHLVPTSVRDALGVLVYHRSPLDTRISFPEEERSAIATVQVILDAVSEASGSPVGLATGGGQLTGLVIRLGAQAQVARDLLFQALNESSWARPDTIGQPPLSSWALTYDPTTDTYYMNLRTVFREEPWPGGGVVLIEAQRATPE
jgi:hypothetical protein